MTIRNICYDKILPSELFRAIPFRNISTGGRTRAISPIGKTWPNGSTLSIRFMEGSPEQKEIVKQYAPQWTEYANLNFEFNDAFDADIRIAFANDGAWSYVGTDAKGIHVSRPTMNFGWLDEGVVLHEFGHAISLAHEHQNPDKGISWNEEAVIRDLSGPPNNWDVATIRHNVLRKYSHNQVNGTAFDAKSIMLYSFPAEWTTDGFHTEPNDVLSDIDKQFAASVKMYPGRGTKPDIVQLEVQEIKPLEAAIGEPGEEDLYKFQVSSSGKYTIETGGETDLVMKLYGPDSPTVLIAEDDDSGQGFNSKITANLVPGEYLVQVLHYNQSGGTGSYGIKVSK